MHVEFGHVRTAHTRGIAGILPTYITTLLRQIQCAHRMMNDDEQLLLYLSCTSRTEILVGSPRVGGTTVLVKRVSHILLPSDQGCQALCPPEKCCGKHRTTQATYI